MFPTHHSTTALWQFIRLFVLTFFLWLLTLLAVKSLISNGKKVTDKLDHETVNSQIVARIDAAFAQLDVLKEINLEMKQILEVGEQNENSTRNNNPPAVYEENRRLLELNLKELLYTIQSKNQTFLEGIDFNQVRDIYRNLQGLILSVRNNDGFESQRVVETKELSQIIQKRIYALQHPKNCPEVKKLVGKLNKDCGFGCQIHHVCYCLIVAYASGRMLLLDSREWRYDPAGWEAVFQPISGNCVGMESIDVTELEHWSSVNASDAQVLFLPIVDDINPIPNFLPVSIPSDISARLEQVHGEPHVWWVGQFMAYLLQPQPELQAILDDAQAKIGIRPVTVGIHIRRTDKIGTEAAYHSLDEYMYHAEEYFAILDAAAGNGLKRQRRVFIASDDPSVILEAKSKYHQPHWKILGNTKTALSASVRRRYKHAGLIGIIQDVVLLSECDFIVCTFSSQVSRLAYELMQSKKVDAFGRFVSLDNIYHYGGGVPLHQQVIIAHKPRSAEELELRLGDELILAGNHWNGSSTGTNLRTNKIGLFPSYKAKNMYPKMSFPESNWWTNSYSGGG